MCLFVITLKEVILSQVTSMMKGMLAGLVESGGHPLHGPSHSYFWEVCSGTDHFLVLVSVPETTSSSVSLLVSPGRSKKISKLTLGVCSVSGSCIFCLPG